MKSCCGGVRIKSYILVKTATEARKVLMPGSKFYIQGRWNLEGYDSTPIALHPKH